MENQIAHIKEKFNALNKPVQLLICFAMIVILGSLLFSMGKQIGEVIYKAYAN